MIVVDAYRQPYIPFYLATREFFARGRATTSTPGGVVLINVGHPSGSDRLEKVLSATMGRVFTDGPARPGRARRTPCCVGTDAPASARALDAAARALPPDLAAGDAPRPPRGWRPRCAGGDVYTDDRAPVEWLIDASIVQVAAEGDR